MLSTTSKIFWKTQGQKTRLACAAPLVALALCGGPTPALANTDTDGDGISDAQERIMGTNPRSSDTDADGYPDAIELKAGYDPRDPIPIKAKKSIRVRLTTQKLSYYVGTTKIGGMPISSGKWNLPTPKGTFSITNKAKRAYSKAYGLYMPYWMAFKGGKFGIHELPEWPNGRKEGAGSLGKPVSHGCIRLGVGNAEKLYDWTPVGTPLTITD